tara:strand:+ start:996 stop:1616 length:621 start_codon:yes stop_codon:yes gene_type:complete
MNLLVDCRKLKIIPNDRLVNGLEIIVKEHLKWNQIFNLSGHRTKQNVWTYQILDSLSPHQFIKTGNLLDIGTGPGFPGLPLALMYPDTHVTLLDSNEKKLAFARHIQSICKLDNVTVVHNRIEEFQVEKKFDQIISRAFKHLNGMIHHSLDLLTLNGEILAMKGARVDSEILDAETEFERYAITLHKLPHIVDEQRMLVLVKQRKK